ncbi:Cellular retinaldehyde-binding/triple function [Lasiodiplodia theobromae]|nr:Cellular retinaldehyde-binding/triple function [Lasiodiplodia theobromae]
MAKDDTELQRVDSYQYPAAHLGHLTANQQAALDKFKDLCKDAGYYRPTGVDGKKIASHDDETMLRYLRARKFSPPEALKQFKDTEDWRKENSLAELYDTIDVTEYEETRRLYPQWTGRRDKRGIPVYLFEVAHLNSKNMAAYDSSHKEQASKASDNKVPTKMLRLFALYENLTRFVMPLCSAVPGRAHPETPISQSNNIVDISHVGLKQFWNLKGHMQDASTLATAHYPETLDRIFIIGAPSFFPTVWSWIKRWFDPITVSKIFILTDKNMKETLEQYIDVENIPKKYGGKLDFEFGDMPVLEPQIAERLKFVNPSVQKGANTIPTGPVKWEESPGGAVQAVAVGSEGGKPRRQIVAELQADTSLKAMHASAVAGVTPVYEKADPLATTTGTYTQPADDTNGEIIETPPSDNTPADSVSGKVKEEEEPKANGAAAVSATDDATRTGTSETRFADQADTHAHNQLKEGTPHDAVNDHGHGDKTVTMEPGTIGQAPKDVSQPLPSADNDGEKKEDERVDKMDGKQVEDFLREKNGSHPTTSA